MQTKNINVGPVDQKVVLNNAILSKGHQGCTAPPLPPRALLINGCRRPVDSPPTKKVEVEGYGPYKPVPPPKPLPQQQSPTCQTPPPYRMPPYPLYNEPSIPGAAAGLDAPTATSSPNNPQALQTHSSKFPIEREVILSSTDKNSKIPILHEYKKKAKAAAIAPDVPPKQMAAWTQAHGQLSPIQTAHVIDQATTDQAGGYRGNYHASQDIYNSGNTGAVPRSAWQGADIIRPSPAPRQYLQGEDASNNAQTVIVQIENGKDNNKDSNKAASSKSVTKTYNTIKDLISNRFKSSKDNANSDDKPEEPGLNNMTDELRKSARSIDRLGGDDYQADFKNSASEQGIYSKPIQQQQHQFNQQVIQQHVLASQQATRQQAIHHYQQQFKTSQPTFYHLQENQQVYYHGPYGSAPQRPPPLQQRYSMSQQADSNYVLLQHQQLPLQELTTPEKRSTQQIERDQLRQKTFEARRAASHPQLAVDDESVDNNIGLPSQAQIHPPPVRRGSHGNLIEAINIASTNGISNNIDTKDPDHDSDDGGFLRRKNELFKDASQEIAPEIITKEESYNDSKIPDALVGSPRKRLEGEIGKIEGVYNIGQKAKNKVDLEAKNARKSMAESGASSDYDKTGGQSSSNVDSGRGSAAYSSGRRPGEKGLQDGVALHDLHNSNTNYKDLYQTDQDSEWVDVVENELRTILEPKLHELSLHSGNVGVSNSTLSESISSMTPPLPPLSPGDQSSPNVTPRNSTKFKKHHSLPYNSKPEYGHDSYNKFSKGHSGIIGPSAGRWLPAGSGQKHHQRSTKKNIADHSAFRSKHAFGFDNTDLTSTTTRSLDLESILDNQSDSDGDVSTADARTIRKQLESLEGMYSEVLKLLGVKKHPGRYQPSDPRFSKRRYGSMSSLPSSSVSSRPIRDKRRMHEDRKKVKDVRGVNKRFQRLESHVVTLARSVAHLSSEMRTQHLMIQEMENIRGEISSLRTQTNMLSVRSQSASRAAQVAQQDLPNLTNPTRVKKLTKFFGDEPPLLRLFLRKLGYEKYANVFENERVGMVELPYLSEERLQKMGVPLGPRLRILQEAQISVCKDTTLCIV